MGSVDDRTFKVNFTADGAAMLRERVNEKLKEFMGDYTDDILVVRAQKTRLLLTNTVLCISKINSERKLVWEILSSRLLIGFGTRIWVHMYSVIIL